MDEKVREILLLLKQELNDRASVEDCTLSTNLDTGGEELLFNYDGIPFALALVRI